MDRSDLEEVLTTGRVAWKHGADLEFEAMRFVYNNLVRLDPAARQRVIGHVMGMLKDEGALAVTNGHQGGAA